MTVENEINEREESVNTDERLININDEEVYYEQGSRENHYSGTVALEPEFEKQNSLGSTLAHAKENEDNTSVVLQVEDENEDQEQDVPDSNVTQKRANTYAAKKTVAQGMMDIALITANANQLRFIIEFNSNSSTYYLNLILIVISLFLQVGVGVSLIFKGRLDLRGESKHQNAKRINNYVVVGIFLVTIINVFIASFTITGTGNKQ